MLLWEEETLRGKELWLIIAGLILLNVLTIAYFSTKSQAANGLALSNEKVATIGNYSVSRQEWLNELEARYGKAVLKDMIDQKVIKEIAAKNKITVSDKEVEQAYKMTQATYGASSPDRSIDEKKWKEQIKTGLLLEELLTKDVIVSKQEMKSYYKKNKNQFNVPTSYHLSHIVVKTKDEAQHTLKELSEGSSFFALAMERSIDEFSANQGGDIGYINEEDRQYPAEYITEAKSLKVGKWSTIIKVDQGYSVIQLHNMIEGKLYSYDEVKHQIRRKMAMEQLRTPASARTFWDEAKVSWFYDNK